MLLVQPTVYNVHYTNRSQENLFRCHSCQECHQDVIRFVRQCKSTPYLIVRTVSHLVPVIHVQLPQATASVTVDLTHCGTPYSDWNLRHLGTPNLLWTSPTAEHPTHLWPGPEKYWRFSDWAFLRWWLHAWVLLPRTLPKFSTLGPPGPEYGFYTFLLCVWNQEHITKKSKGVLKK